MAKIIYGPVIINARGSVAGNTFSSGHWGNFTRKLAIPTKIKTPARSVVHSRLTLYSRRWSGALDSAQRTDWSDLAATVNVTDPFGNDFPLTGPLLYNRVNQRLAQANYASLDDAPLDQTVTPLSTLDFTATSPSSFEITFTPDPLPENHLLYAFATANLRPGISNPTHRYAWFLAAAPETASPYDASAAYLARFVRLTPGLRIFLRAATLNVQNGALSDFLSVTRLIVT